MPELNTFFHIAHDLFCILDEHGFYKRVNPAFLKLLGYTEDELVKHPFTYYLHPDDVAATTKEFEAASQGRRNQVVENRFRNKDGAYHWTSWSTIVQDEAGVFYSVGQNITMHKQLQEALHSEQEASQKRITKAIILTQERERSQISRELHDNVNQVLTSVKLYLELCQDSSPNTKELLQRSIQLQQTVISEIRSLSKRLSSPSLGNIRLCDSIRELVQVFSEINIIAIELNTEEIEELEVNQEVHLAVYRILQEQLTNIYKHSEANRVIINLDFVGGILIMLVQDNGKGFDSTVKTSGIGIQNMHTRAQSVGGFLLIRSTKGAGTEIQLHIPLMNEGN